MIIRFIVTFLFFITALVLDGIFFPAIGIFGLNIVEVFLVFLFFIFPYSKATIIFGLALGIIAEWAIGSGGGLFAAPFIIVGFFVGILRNFFYFGPVGGGLLERPNLLMGSLAMLVFTIVFMIAQITLESFYSSFGVWPDKMLFIVSPVFLLPTYMVGLIGLAVVKLCSGLAENYGKAKF